MASAAPNRLPPPAGPRPITHVLFDMDGLLLDTETCYTTAQAAVLARYGREFSKELKGKRSRGLGGLPLQSCKPSSTPAPPSRRGAGASSRRRVP